MDIFESVMDRLRPKEKGTGVTVSFTEKRAFTKLTEKLPPGTVDIKMETWQETDGTVPISNHGAGPCVIIYAVDRTTGHVISGHFPEVLKRRQDMFTRGAMESLAALYPETEKKGSEILIPDPDQINRLSYVRVDKSYEAYTLMKKRLQEWIKSSGQENVEVYLFGNNDGAFGKDPAEYSQRIVESAIEQQEVAADLYKIGIAYANQHDHRTAGQDNVDDTFYTPRDRVIKHSIRDHRDDGKFWIK